jgi:hypothetical protein
MTTPDDGSIRITGPSSTTQGHGSADHDHVGTRSDRDVTSRMTGTATTPAPTSTSSSTTTTGPGAPAAAKTSAAAVFGLVFGLASLFCALTGILAPAAVVFGLIGLVVAIAGRKMAQRPGVTGKGVATGGLVTAVIGLLLGAAVLAGLAAVVNDQGALDRISRYVDNAKQDLPSGSELTSKVPGQ